MKSIFFLFMVIAFNCNALTDVEEAFIQDQLIPDISDVAPKKIVYVTYPGGVIVDLGNELTPTQTKDIPQVLWEAEKGAYYTFLMIDADAPSREDRKYGSFRHWLIFNILESDIESGDVVFEYRSPGPRIGSGLHRYIFLVFKQPNGIIEPDEPHVDFRAMGNRFMETKLDEKYNLTSPQFGNYFQCKYDSYVDVLVKNNEYPPE